MMTSAKRAKEGEMAAGRTGVVGDGKSLSIGDDGAVGTEGQSSKVEVSRRNSATGGEERRILDGKKTPTEGPSHRAADKQPRQPTTPHDQVPDGRVEERREEGNVRSSSLGGLPALDGEVCEVLRELDGDYLSVLRLHLRDGIDDVLELGMLGDPGGLVAEVERGSDLERTVRAVGR